MLEPKKWKPWYNQVVHLYMHGETIENIAHATKSARSTIKLLIESKLFDEKIATYIEEHKSEAYLILQRHKITLIKEKLSLALSKERDSLKNEALSWCLERFPEFSPRAAKAVTNNLNVYQHSPEDTERINCAVDKLQRLQQLLANGNPNVIDAASPMEQVDMHIQEPAPTQNDNRPKEDTDTTRGDTQAQEQFDTGERVCTQST